MPDTYGYHCCSQAYIFACGGSKARGQGHGGAAHRAGLSSSGGRLGRADAHGVEARAALARDAHARLRWAQRYAQAGQRGIYQGACGRAGPAATCPAEGRAVARSPACRRARRRGTAGRGGSPRQGRAPGRARTGDRARRQQAPSRHVVRVQHLSRPPQPGLHARPHQLADRLRVARVAVQAHHRLHLRARPQTLSCVGTTACTCTGPNNPKLRRHHRLHLRALGPDLCMRVRQGPPCAQRAVHADERTARKACRANLWQALGWRARPCDMRPRVPSRP